jgi:hypothetical protein
MMQFLSLVAVAVLAVCLTGHYPEHHHVNPLQSMKPDWCGWVGAAAVIFLLWRLWRALGCHKT